jgi:hypothetical protein
MPVNRPGAMSLNKPISLAPTPVGDPDEPCCAPSFNGQYSAGSGRFGVGSSRHFASQHFRARAGVLLNVAIVIATMTAAVSHPAEAQTQTRCVRQDNRTLFCATKPAAPPLDGYANALGTTQELESSYQDQERNRQQIEQLRLNNEMMRRQLEVQAAPSYDQRQCRRSAKAAIDAGDLVLARDVLKAFAGGQ